MTAKDRIELDGKNPYSATFGEEGDILNLCRFGFYKLVYYWENTDCFSELKKHIGRALGPTKNQGNEMAQYILKETGVIVPQTTVKKIPLGDLRDPRVREQICQFNSLIQRKHGMSMNKKSHVSLKKMDYVRYDVESVMPENDFNIGSTNVNLREGLINAEFMIHNNNDKLNPTYVKATVLRKIGDGSINIEGTGVSLDGGGFEIEFEDGH